MRARVSQWIWTIALAIGLFCLVYIPNWQRGFRALSDGFLVPGAILLSIAGFIYIGRSGTFDVTGYSFMRLGESLRREPRKTFKDAYDYAAFKNEQRNKNKPYYWPYLVLGGLGVALAILFALL